MKKILLTISLSLILTVSGFAGEIPITGVAGCAPGLWYPESQVCVFDLAAPIQTPGPAEPTILDNSLVGIIIQIRSILF